MRVCFLSTINSPLLNDYIDVLSKYGIEISLIILDSKLNTEKDLRLYEERMGCSIENNRIYSFDHLTIPFYFFSNTNNKDCSDFINSMNIDLVINAGASRIYGNRVLNCSSLGAVNVHPGLLPDYRGCSCVEWAIFNDDKIGNTVYIMSEGIDEGIVLNQETYVFKNTDGYTDIRKKVYYEGLKLLAKTIKNISVYKKKNGKVVVGDEGVYYKPIPQVKMNKVLDKIQSGSYRYQI